MNNQRAVCALDQGVFVPTHYDEERYPSTVNGKAAFYFYKDIAHIGHFENGNWSMDLDRGDINALSKKINDMRSEGIPIPFVLGINHGEKGKDPRNVKPWETLGYVMCAKPSETEVMGRSPGDDLMALFQIIGEDSWNVAAKNFVSMVRDPDAKDGAGRKWGDAVVNVAATPNPVIENQGPFVKAASRQATDDEIPLLISAAKENSNMTNWPCSKEHEEALNSHVPGLSKVPTEGKIPHVVGHLDAHKAALGRIYDGIRPMCQSMGKTFSDDKPEEHLLAIIERLKAPATESRPPAVSLSKEQIEILQDRTDLYHERFTSAFEKGSLTPAQFKMVQDWLPRDKPNVIALSKQDGTEQRLADFVLNFIKAGDSRRVETGPKSGVQALSREIPDPSGRRPESEMRRDSMNNLKEEDNPLIQVRKRAARSA